MATWNHRVIKSTNEYGETWYQIHEVHYNDAGELTMYTERPIAAAGETLEELRDELQLMLEATEREVLEQDKIVYAKPDWDDNEPTITLEELSHKLGLEKNGSQS